MPPLAKNLFKTFIIATVTTIVFNCAYYAYIVRGNVVNYQAIVTKIAGATLLLTVILSIMSLPVLFLFHSNYRNNLWSRIALYFCGPVVFITAALTVQLSPSDRIFDLITGITFISIHTVFYYLTTKTDAGYN